MTRLMLVEDHSVLLEALALVLGNESDFQIAVQSQSLAEARARLTGVDVALVKFSLPDGTGIELIPDLREANPNVRVLMFSESESRLDHAMAIEAGADGYLHKSASIEYIISAIRKVMSAQPIHTQQEILELVRLAARQREEVRRTQSIVGQLTPREREILQTLAYGLSERDIARKLNISENTVRNHVVSILGKLDVHSRLQAALFAARVGIVDLTPPDSDAWV